MKHIANCLRVKQAHVLIIKSKNEKNLQKSHAAHSLQNNNSTEVTNFGKHFEKKCVMFTQHCDVL
jgi:hypothetical protein